MGGEGRGEGRREGGLLYLVGSWQMRDADERRGSVKVIEEEVA